MDTKAMDLHGQSLYSGSLKVTSPVSYSHCARVPAGSKLGTIHCLS
jgi:hypothetical protein